MDENKRRLYVEKNGFWTEAAMLLIGLAVVFRLIGSVGRWEDARYLFTQVALPAFSGLLFLLCLLLLGKRAFWTTVIPVVLGVVFFIFRIMGVENEWQIVGCIAMYVVIAVLYAMAFSVPKLKWALAAILALAFVGHVILDVPELMDLENPLSFVDGMQEMSVLGIILSLLCTSVAMKYPAAPAAPAPAQPAVMEQPAEPAVPVEEPEDPQQPLAPWEPWSPEQTPLQESAPESMPESAPEPEETLPAPSQIPVEELGFVAEPAPAFPIDEANQEEIEPAVERSTENA